MLSNKNNMAIVLLKRLGYPLPNIRKSMHKLTGITQPEIAKRLKVTRANITQHIDGSRDNPKIQEGIADIFRVQSEEFFSDSANTR